MPTSTRAFPVRTDTHIDPHTSSSLVGVDAHIDPHTSGTFFALFCAANRPLDRLPALTFFPNYGIVKPSMGYYLPFAILPHKILQKEEKT